MHHRKVPIPDELYVILIESIRTIVSTGILLNIGAFFTTYGYGSIICTLLLCFDINHSFSSKSLRWLCCCCNSQRFRRCSLRKGSRHTVADTHDSQARLSLLSSSSSRSLSTSGIKNSHSTTPPTTTTTTSPPLPSLDHWSNGLLNRIQLYSRIGTLFAGIELFIVICILITSQTGTLGQYTVKPPYLLPYGSGIMDPSYCLDEGIPEINCFIFTSSFWLWFLPASGGTLLNSILNILFYRTILWLTKLPSVNFKTTTTTSTTTTVPLLPNDNASSTTSITVTNAATTGISVVSDTSLISSTESMVITEELWYRSVQAHANLVNKQQTNSSARSSSSLSSSSLLLGTLFYDSSKKNTYCTTNANGQRIIIPDIDGYRLLQAISNPNSELFVSGKGSSASFSSSGSKDDTITKGLLIKTKDKSSSLPFVPAPNIHYDNNNVPTLTQSVYDYLTDIALTYLQNYLGCVNCFSRYRRDRIYLFSTTRTPLDYLVAGLRYLVFSWLFLSFITVLWYSISSITYPDTWNNRYETYCSGDKLPNHVTLTSHYPKFQQLILTSAGYYQLGLGLFFIFISIFTYFTVLYPYWYIQSIRTVLDRSSSSSSSSSSALSTISIDNNHSFDPFNYISLSRSIAYTDNLRYSTRLFTRFYLVFFFLFCGLFVLGFINWVVLSSLAPELASWYVIPSSTVPLSGTLGIDICGPCEQNIPTDDTTPTSSAATAVCTYTYTSEGISALYSIGGRLTYAVYGIILSLAIPDIITIVSGILILKLRDNVQSQTQEHLLLSSDGSTE